METENSDGTQTTITQGPTGQRQVLHVRQDSATDLDNLFKFSTALNPDYRSNSKPMTQRALPKSFFQQPDRPRGVHAHSQSMGGLVSMSSNISHSRSSSTDSSASHHSNLSHGMNNVNQNSSVQINAGHIGHRQSFTPGPAQRRLISQNKANHLPQHPNAMQQVPQAFAHSRSKSLPVSLKVMNQNLIKSAQDVDVPAGMPLPPNWEMAETPDGQKYFMNHATRTTTWEDPRIPILKEQQQQQQERTNESSPHNSPMHATQNEFHGQQLPPGWEQSMTPQGEVYFINHETRSTSWLDPRRAQIGLNSQAAGPPHFPMNTQLQQQMNQLDIGQSSGSFQHPGRMSVPPMMKQLTKERDNLMKMRMMKQVGTGMDPFLGTASNYHERERSCDSGVGSMGSNYVLPKTPEDFLGQVEEMDTGDSRQAALHGGGSANHSNNNSHQRQNSQPQRFPDFLSNSAVDFPGNSSGHVSTSESISASNTRQAAQGSISGEDVSENYLMNDVDSLLSPVKSENIDTLSWL